MKKLFNILTLALTAAVARVACYAESGAGDDFTARAATDMTNLQYRVMRLAAAGNPPTCNIASHNLGSSAAGAVAGVLQNNPSSGQAATLRRSGLSKAVAGAAVTANAFVTHDGSGYVIDAVSGSMVIGRALEAAANAGERLTVMLQPAVRWGSVA
jgi:hypothetical protein